MMKGKDKHRMSAREAALRGLVRVEEDQAYLNLALPPYLSKLGSDDRALAIQLATGTIQRLNSLDWAIGLYSRRSLKSFTPWLRNLLRLSAYQIIYLDRIPDYAVVDEAVRLAYRFGHRGVASLANALLRRLALQASNLPWPEGHKNRVEQLSLRESHPTWLVKRYINSFGFAEAKLLCRANNLKPRLSIRPNLLRITPDRLMEILSNDNIASMPSENVPNMLTVEPAAYPVATEAFRDGLFTIQGESSALVAPLLLPHSGETIVDLCSAPGGKTTHLAELINDRGLIYAVDLHPNRLRLVEQAARRLGLTIIRPIVADGRTLNRKQIRQPRAVLVDAPCSGLGVIRRLPELKWRRKEADLPALQSLQVALLRSAATLLPVGGRLLYSVCTNMMEETNEVVQLFTRENSNFAAEALCSRLPERLQDKQLDPFAVSFYPHRHALDGFYIASWLKKR
jgi:16S rRNA (cytosine967-C5)-methyltransferase